MYTTQAGCRASLLLCFFASLWQIFGEGGHSKTTLYFWHNCGRYLMGGGEENSWYQHKTLAILLCILITRCGGIAKKEKKKMNQIKPGLGLKWVPGARF